MSGDFLTECAIPHFKFLNLSSWLKNPFQVKYKKGGRVLEVVTTLAPIALALIMLALGLGLSVDDFSRVLRQPKDFLIGLLCQLILLPIIAFI